MASLNQIFCHFPSHCLAKCFIALSVWQNVLSLSKQVEKEVQNQMTVAHNHQKHHQSQNHNNDDDDDDVSSQLGL